MPSSDLIKTWQTYLKGVQRTAPPTLTKDNITMGLYGESGEVVDTLKKIIYHEIPAEQTNLKEELGDLCWYAAAAYTQLLTEEERQTEFFPGIDITDCLIIEYVYGLHKGVGHALLGEWRAAVKRIIFYVRALCETFGFHFPEVLRENTAKLERVYPHGFVSGGGNRVEKEMVCRLS